jgi:hypothetical protein
MIFAAWDVKEWATVVAPAVVLLVGVITLYVNGERAERWRRRDLHARALAAAIAYTEMPFAIRRRQHEPEHRSAERVRLTTRFSEIQAEISVCQALIDSEGDPRISAAYRELVDATAASPASPRTMPGRTSRPQTIRTSTCQPSRNSFNRSPRTIRRSDTTRSPLTLAQVPRRD